MLGIIGCGNHVKKNILPALDRMKIQPDIIVGRDDNPEISKKLNYSKCIEDIPSSTSLIYIATPISTHYQLIIDVIKRYKHVICEKPIVMSPGELEKIYSLADEYNVQVYQVEMFKHHHQFLALKEIISDNSNGLGALNKFNAEFCIPKLPLSDIRYNKDLGGGAILDLGFYPVSLVCELFDDLSIEYIQTSIDYDFNVDLNGQVIWRNNKTLISTSWCLGSCYSNKVELYFENGSVTVDRAFSKPYDNEVTIEIVTGFNKEIRTFKDDHFVNMISEIIQGNINIDNHREKTMKTINHLSRIYESTHV